MVTVKFVAVYVVLVSPVMSVKFVLSVEDFHCISPVFPLSVKSVLFVVLQRFASPAMVPPTDTGLIVIIPALLFAAVQTPFETIAL